MNWVSVQTIRGFCASGCGMRIETRGGGIHKVVIGDNGPMGKDSEARSGWMAVQQACPLVEVAAIADAAGPYAVITHPGAVFKQLIRFFAKHPIAS